jgi:prepilin peptidase CpaA
MDTSRIIGLCVLVVLLAWSVYTELTAQRIPNWLTMTGMAAGLLLGYLPGGISLGSSLVGFCIGFGFLLIFYLYGGMGGGDVKLMGAVGALLGYPLIVPAIVYTAFIGLVLALFRLLSQRAFWLRAGRLARRCTGGAATTAEAPPIQRTVPYGLAIAAGTLLVLFVAGAAP